VGSISEESEGGDDGTVGSVDENKADAAGGGECNGHDVAAASVLGNGSGVADCKRRHLVAFVHHAVTS